MDNGVVPETSPEQKSLDVCAARHTAKSGSLIHKRLLAINWNDSGTQSFTFDLAGCGISSDMKAADFWSGTSLSHDGKRLQFELQPHTCRLIEFRR